MTIHTTTRRAVLAGSAALPAAILPIAAEPAAPACPAIAAYRHWRALRDAFEAGTLPQGSADEQRLHKAMWAAEAKLYEAQPARAEGLACQLAAAAEAFDRELLIGLPAERGELDGLAVLARHAETLTQRR